MNILVTGAMGNVGREVVRGLQAHNITFRVGEPNEASARTVLNENNDNVEITHFDFLKPDTFQATFAGIERMFLVRPPALANVQRDIAPAIAAALEAGVQHIVFLSLQGVEKNRVVPHHKIEQLILEAGVHYTFLRAGFFMQNLSTTHRAEIRDRNEIALPVGKAKTSFIDVRDIADVAVCALMNEGHENRKYTLTGSEALDYYQIAEKLSSILQRKIRYTDPSIITFIRRQLAQGQKPGYTLIMTALYTLTRFGNASVVTDDVAMILKRPPIDFEQFAQDYSACWKPNTASETVTSMQRVHAQSGA